MSSSAPVVIVGAGAAGLSAAGALARRGIRAAVLEQDRHIGGTWARRYDRLHLHTTRRFSGLAHYPIPRRYPEYLSRDHVVAYLEEYAAHFHIDVATGVAVGKIGRPPGSIDWIIDTGDARRRAPVVVVATGQYRRPIVPPWPGRDGFRGTFTHSVDYRNAMPYVGRRVLVVGAGNSGAEIATDLVDGGATFVAISVRSSPPIVPRDPFGMPVQRTSILLSAFPACVGNTVGRITARLALGDLTRFGMPAASFVPYTAKRVPLIDVGFVDALKRRRVAVRPAVERLTETGVVFADGAEEAFDAIVAATGFSTGLEALLEPTSVLDAEGVPRGRAGDPTSEPGLYFVGYTHSLRGHLFEANLASRRLARHAEHYLKRLRASA